MTAKVSPREFIARLGHGGAYGYYWQADGKLSTWWPADQPAAIPNGRTDTYFGVNSSKVKKSARERATIEDIAAVNCKFAEVDGKDWANPTPEETQAQLEALPAEPALSAAVALATAKKRARDARFQADRERYKTAALAHIRTLDPQPSVIIDSGGGYHLYWLLREPFEIRTDEDRERAAGLQRRWVERVGGDDGAKDLARILRVPGTRNYKYSDAPTVAVIEYNPERLYWFDELEVLAPPPRRDARPVAPSGDYSSDDAGEHWLGKAIDRLARNARNATGFWLACQLRDSGLSQTQGEPIMREYQRRVESAGDHLYTETEAMDNLKSAYKTTAREPAVSQNGGKPQRRAAARKQPKAAPAKTTSTDDSTQLSEPPETAQVDDLTRFLRSAGAHDEGNADCLKAIYGDKFLYSEALGWMAYDGTHWDTERAEAVLDRATVDVLLRRMAAAATIEPQLDGVMNAAKPNAYRKRGCQEMFRSKVTVKVSDFDNDPDLLNVANGVLDLRTGELAPHHPAQRFTYCLPVAFDENADWGPWLDFLGAAVADPQLGGYLQEAVGYSLTGHTREEVLFYVYGPTRSGKGVFGETVMAMMGHKPLATEVDFSTFTASRDGDTQNFDLAPLKPCRFVAASESRRYTAMNESKLKALTGGNEIYCAFKHRTHFSYRPQFKIWLSSNHPVNADPDDDAVWYRIRVIEFPHSFAGREDKLLKESLRRPEVLRGVLSWAVAGAIKWYGRAGQGLETPDQVATATARARAELDMVGAWLSECIVKVNDPEAFVSNAELYSSYEGWCKDNGVTPKKQRSLTMALNKKGYAAGEQKKINGRNRRGCLGVKLAV